MVIVSKRIFGAILGDAISDICLSSSVENTAYLSEVLRTKRNAKPSIPELSSYNFR